MNILFVNHGDFTTNSLTHIAGFAAALGDSGHACAVAAPEGKPPPGLLAPGVRPATYGEALAHPKALFPNGRPADLVHAWTPREGVRKFVLACRRRAPLRLVVHLEDDEECLIESYFGRPAGELRDKLDAELPKPVPDTLAHPTRYRSLLRLADGVTLIVAALQRLVPPGVPSAVTSPGVDFDLYRPQAPDPKLRAKLGLRPEEKAIVFTGSPSYAGADEVRELGRALVLLNRRGAPTRLVRTGRAPDFLKVLGAEAAPFAIDLGFTAKERLPGLLALADALVQPGRPGPFDDGRLPSKVPEYLAMGRPVVLPAANVGLALRDGDEAILLRNGSGEEIADACARLFADPELARRLGQNAPAFARANFDLKANTAGLAAFYSRCLARPPAAPPAADLSATEASLLAEQLRRELGRIASGMPGAADLAEAAADLSRLCRQLEAEIGPGRPRLGELEAAFDRLAEKLGQREGKIGAMQDSLSWRLTAPLRALRRLCVDRK